MPKPSETLSFAERDLPPACSAPTPRVPLGGTPITLDDLAARHAGELYRLALSILDDPAEADDAVQETLVSAARALDDFHGASSLRTWLFAIAINACRAQLRRRRARRALEVSLAALQRLITPGGGRAAGLEEQVIARERRGELWCAVRCLDEKHRLVVVLRYVHDLPVAEIAALLRLNEGTVHSRLHYARSKLLERLGSGG